MKRTRFDANLLSPIGKRINNTGLSACPIQKSRVFIWVMAALIQHNDLGEII